MQANRPMALKVSGLGEDDLMLTSASGSEGISRLFSISVEAIALKKVNFASAIGASATVRINGFSAGEQRFLNGIVSEFALVGADENNFHYSLTIVPKFWLATRKSNLRFFKDKPVKDILTEVLGPYNANLSGVTGVAATQPNDFIAQYRETDFAFACRLMERDGVRYYFKHSDGSHQLMLSDNPAVHPPLPGNDKLVFEPDDVGGNFGAVTRLSYRQAICSGKAKFRDNSLWKHKDNFETAGSLAVPTVTVGGNSIEFAAPAAANSLELEEYPGDAAQRGDGTTQRSGDPNAILTSSVAARLAEGQVGALAVAGSGTMRNLVSGHSFSFVDTAAVTPQAKAFNVPGAFFLVSVNWQGHQGSYDSVSKEEPFTFSSSFVALPKAMQYRPARSTPKPIVPGAQAAVVVGGTEGDVETDALGRVKVQFYWDKAKAQSCWARDASPIAGQKFGMIHIPRIGHEVLVAFEEGDPDRPMVVGSLYNSTNTVPYDLPANKTQSGYKTCSFGRKTPGANFNELRFEDKSGAEEIYFHAQMDFKRVVERDDTLTVGRDQTEEITRHRTTTIKEGNETHTVKTGNRTETLEKGNDKLTLNVGNRTITLDKGNDELTLTKGNRTAKMTAGTDTVEAMQSITLKVGANKIVIDQKGISLSGIKIDIQGTAQTKVGAPMIDIAGPMIKIGGGLVKIN